MGVINRPAFESQLHAHLENPQSADFEDPVWYAVRNTVYAHGCRIELSDIDYSSTFAHAHKESWKYFQNALSVTGELFFPREDLGAIQALTLMVCRSPACRLIAFIYADDCRAFTPKASPAFHWRPCFSATLCDWHKSRISIGYRLTTRIQVPTISSWSHVGCFGPSTALKNI